MKQQKSILIVEDEPIIADDIAFTLEDLGYHVVGIAATYQEAMELFEEKKPDLVLLDIMIKGSKNGIEVGRQLQVISQTPFIYLTSLYDKDTLDLAQETAPMGYIVKPFKEADLEAGIQLAFRKQQIIPQRKVASKKLFVRENGMMLPIDPEQVLYVEANDNYAIIHTLNGKKTVTQTLKKMEALLIDHGFCRVHKTFLINMDKIDMVEHSVVFINGTTIPIGKAYRKPFFDLLTVF